ncbi:MAG: OmpA family protein [Pirellulales bacterium]
MISWIYPILRSCLPSAARRRLAGVWWLALVAAVGCQNSNWSVPVQYHQSQLQAVHQQQLAAQQQTQQYLARAGNLDQNNQQLQQMLAESRQQVQLLQSHLNAVRDRLKTSNDQIARLESDKIAIQQRVETLEASATRGGGAILTANSNLRDRLPQIDVQGVDVALDGDVVRCRIPSDMLFVSKSSQFLTGADVTLEKVAKALSRAYPNQVIGIEGHTDNGPLAGGSAHHLTAAQALAVQDLLVEKRIMPAGQVFAAGHGANQPVYSNATASGQQRNRRIEFVVYSKTTDGDR